MFVDINTTEVGSNFEGFSFEKVLGGIIYVGVDPRSINIFDSVESFRIGYSDLHSLRCAIDRVIAYKQEKTFG